MASASLPRYITVADFERMEFADERDYELLDGEVLEVSIAGLDHFIVGERLVRLLRELLASRAVVGREMPFVIAPGTKRSADVAAVDAARFVAAEQTMRLVGSPELVIEIVSPSNRTRRDLRTARLCLRNGALQFWFVHLDDRTVDIQFADNRVKTYEAGSRIPLPEPLGGGEIAVDDVFPEGQKDEPPLS